MSYKETDTHIYFWGSYLSNFAAFSFDFHLTEHAPATRALTSEHAFMWLKAITFGDFKTLELMLDAIEPKDVKALGRKVVGFDPAVWHTKSYECMYRALAAKFSQNQDIQEQLIASAPKTIVEGSPLDRIWGVGLAWNDPKILDQANWLGENRLGKLLMQLRWDLIQGRPLRYVPSKVLGTL